MDGVAFQGMPRIALTPAEEALIPRPHSSASQVATAVPSAYARTSSPSPSSNYSRSPHPHHKNHHNSITYHPYYSNPSAAGSSLTGLGAHLASPSSASIPISPEPYSRPSTPGPGPGPAPRPSSPSAPFPQQQTPYSASIINSTSTSGEQEYPQNPQDSFPACYSQVPPRSASPGPSRLAFALAPRPTRSPSPQLYSNLYDHYQPRSSYFHRTSHDAQPRPGSPLQQEHQDAWETNIRVASPAHGSESEDSDGNDSDDEGEGKGKRQRTPPHRSNSKSILRRLRETTSKLSFRDDLKKSVRSSQESESAPRASQDSSSSTSRPGKEVLHDLSDEEKQQDSRKTRTGWRPSLSLIRQESDGPTVSHYLQNDPHRISDLPSSDSLNNYRPVGDSNKDKKRRRAKNTKSNKNKKRRAKKRRAEQLAAQQRQQHLYEQQLAEQARFLPDLTLVLEKKTRYPLNYDDFEAFLRSQRAVEYLNFWADVTAHEQLCRTFNVSERRQKREFQLEERAIARDRRRVALTAAMESGRLTPDPDLLTPGNADNGAGTGIGIGASGQEIDGSNLYAASRSSLQLPLNDHLSFPQESRRYGVQDSSAAFPPMPPSHPNNHGVGTFASGSYNRILAGGGARRTSGEMSRPSLEEAHISEQDAAVAAVAMRAQHNAMYPYNQSTEDIRRGSFDLYRPMPGAGLSSPRYQQNDSSHGNVGGSLTTSQSTPNAYNLMMRGRGSTDVMARPNSRNSRTRPSGSEDYFGSGVRFSPSPYLNHQLQQQPNTPQLTIQDETGETQEGPMHLRRKFSEQSIGFIGPDLSRRPSISRFGGGVGPLQAPVTLRRSGESAYSPSIFSMGQEGKALLAQSFRTITLEDLQESALRIYRKYLVQLRTASMAAEEEAAASATKESYGSGSDRNKRNSLEKAIAPGWDGYAEEVIAEWNEKWQERRSKRLSSRKSVSARTGDENHGSGQPSVAGDDSGLFVDTRRAHQDSDSQEKYQEGDDDEEEHHAGKSSAPTSPLSAKTKKRTGTGLSAMLNPFLTRLMRTETTVVELPTLTINTTTVEEATVPEDSAEDDEDDEEDDDVDDYDSDEEDNDEEQEGEKEFSRADTGRARNNNDALQDRRLQDELSQQPSSKPPEDTVIIERSMPSSPLPPTGTKFENQRTPNVTAQHIMIPIDGPRSCAVDNTLSSGRADVSPRRSTSSSLSSSWDHITKGDLEKRVTIVPPPLNISSRPTPYQRPGNLHRVRSKTGDAAKSASTAAQKVGWQLSALLRKSVRGTGASSASLDTIQITPSTSPRTEWPTFHFQIPVIVAEHQAADERTDGGKKDRDRNGEDNREAVHRMTTSTSGTNSSFVQLQGEPIFSNPSLLGVPTIAKGSLEIEGSSLQLPKPLLSPALSSTTHPTAPSSGYSSPAPPRFSVSSPAAVAASAAAAAFYLPLECRQRIRMQVQEEGRTYAPYLYGPAKGFVMDVVLQDHYYPLFLKYVKRQNLGLLTRHHPNNIIKQRGMICIGALVWLVVIGLQLTLVLLGLGGWRSPWVWVVGVLGGWTGSICLATGLKGFSPILGLMGKICEDRHIFRFRKILEPSIRFRHRLRAYWMLTYCIFWSTVVMVIFAALPQRTVGQ